jgi:sugar-specific transcriptional regulator TrmB
MDKIVDYLKQLELSDIEAKLYVALLQSGVTGVKELAEKVDVKRTTAYFYIDQLIEKNLIIKVVNKSKKQIAAVDPKEGLEELVKRKLQSAQETKEQFSTMLKSITELNPTVADTQDSEIQYYKGKNGVRKIYEKALQADALRSFVNVTEILEVFPENSQLFDSAFKKNQKIKMYEIVEDSPQARKRFAATPKLERYFYKLLPENMKLSAQDILIYDNKVAIIHFKDTIYGVVLTNADLYNNFKMLFNFIWKILPE